MKHAAKTKVLFEIVALCVLVAMSAVSAIAGEKFTSYNGQFAIDIPDNWFRLDYRTVDYYLSQTADTIADFQYEAVFAPRSDHPFYEGPYLLLTVDTVGRFSRAEIDSTAKDIAASFEIPLVTRPIKTLATDVPVDTAVYDKDQKLTAVLSDYWEAGAIVKKSLLITRFYNRGFATFYFYSPPGEYPKVAPTFQQIVESFTEDITGGNTEKVKVAHIDKEKHTGFPVWLIVVIAAVFILVVVGIIRRQSAAKA